MDLAPEAAQQLWLRVLETYVRLLGELSPNTPQESESPPSPSSLSDLKYNLWRGLPNMLDYCMTDLLLQFRQVCSSLS